MEFPGLDQEEFSEGFHRKNPMSIRHIYACDNYHGTLARHKEDNNKNNGYIRLEISRAMHHDTMNIITLLERFIFSIKFRDRSLVILDFRTMSFVASLYGKKIKLTDTSVEYDPSNYHYEPGLYLDVPIHMDMTQNDEHRYDFSCGINFVFRTVSLWFGNNMSLCKEYISSDIYLSDRLYPLSVPDLTIIYILADDGSSIIEVDKNLLNDDILRPYIWQGYKVYVLNHSDANLDTELVFYHTTDKHPIIHKDDELIYSKTYNRSKLTLNKKTD